MQSRHGVTRAVGGLGVQQESAREAAGGGEAPSKVGASDSVNGDVSDGGVLSSQTARGPWAVGVRDRVGAQTCARVRPPAEQSGRQVGCEGLIIQSLSDASTNNVSATSASPWLSRWNLLFLSSFPQTSS